MQTTARSNSISIASILWQFIRPVFQLSALAALLSGSGAVSKAAEALLVVANAASMNASDLAISSRLVTLGFNVTTISAASSATSQAAGKDLIFVSATINSGDVAAKFRDVTVPVVTGENAIYDDLLMTLNASPPDRGTIGNQTTATIENSSHPLAAGLTGTVQLTTVNRTFVYGLPNANAVVIARSTDGNNRPILFAYDTGATLINNTATAAGRRVGIFLDNDTAQSLTAAGWLLFDTAVAWATAQTSAPAIKTEPQDVSVVQGNNRTASFSTVVFGAPPFSFQWLRNGNEIPGATSSSFTTGPLEVSDTNARFSVRVTNAAGSVTSREAVLTVTADTTPPTILSASGTAQHNSVNIILSEPVTLESATNRSNYSITGGLTITDAKLSSSGDIIELTTSPQNPGTTYTISVSGLQDRANPSNQIAASTQATFTGWVLFNGFLLREFYGGISGTSVASLTNSAKFPGAPDSVTLVPLFESPTDVADNYGVRLSGFVTAPETGEYVFYITSDDNSTLFLSTDESPVNKQPVAREPEWNSSRQWLATTRRNATNPENRSAPIALEAGKRYYIEALVKEGGGGDNLGVTWKLPSQAAPPANGTPPISGQHLSTFVNPDNAVINITQQPQDITTLENTGAIFSFQANASTSLSTNQPILIQWQRNGADISGATGATLSLPNVTPQDSGAKFRAVLTIPGRQVTTAEATLTVTPDITPPALVAANTFTRSDKITLTFSEPVSVATATNPANYSVSGATVLSAQRIAPNQVELTTSSLNEFPAPIAYEGFDYEPGAIPGLSGGTGWSNAWQPNNSPANSALVQAGSMSYTDAKGNRLLTSGGKAFITGTSGTSQPFRELPNVRGATGTTSWFSFIGVRTGPTTNNAAEPNNIYPRAANISLFNMTLPSSQEQLAVGSGTGAPVNTWALLPDGSLANRRGTEASFSQTSFVVVRIDHKEGNDDAYLWINPALDAQPSIANADANSLGAFDYSFNRIRPFAGNPQTTRPFAELVFDELRVGDSFAAIAPSTAGPVLTVTVNGVQDLAATPNTIAANSSIAVDRGPALPAEFGQVVQGYQDDFNRATLNPNWVPRGASTNVYSVSNGSLHVTTAAGDPNHLLYEAAGYDAANQEVLARIRIVQFGTGDAPRGGIGLGVSPQNSEGINFLFRDHTQDNITGRQIKLLDDKRAWGPGFDFRPNGAKWVTNTWYWLRLKQAPNTASGQTDVWAKAWLADGTVPEPENWSLTWDYTPGRSTRTGFAGIAAGSNNGTSILDVDYVLIKAQGLPNIRAIGSEIAPPQSPIPGNDSAETLQNRAITLPAGKLLANDVDILGRTLTITRVSGTSTAGGTVLLSTDTVIYAPPADFVGNDSFTYTVSNGSISSTATVQINVKSPAAPSQNLVARVDFAFGAVVVQFAGIPNRVYAIQASVDLINWNTLGTATAGPRGAITFLDPEGGIGPHRFYRTATP